MRTKVDHASLAADGRSPARAIATGNAIPIATANRRDRPAGSRPSAPHQAAARPLPRRIDRTPIDRTPIDRPTVANTG